MPELYIITGSNGAGKSSIGPEYLPQHIRKQCPVFDGDRLFVEKRKELWRTIKSNKECRNLAYEFVIQTFDNLVDSTLVRKVDFAYEGHFSNGGHYVDPQTVENNFYGNLEKLNQHFSLFNTVQIVDTSAVHRVLAVLNHGEPILAIPSAQLPDWFRIYLPAIFHSIKTKEEEIIR